MRHAEIASRLLDRARGVPDGGELGRGPRPRAATRLRLRLRLRDSGERLQVGPGLAEGVGAFTRLPDGKLETGGRRRALLRRPRRGEVQLVPRPVRADRPFSAAAGKTSFSTRMPRWTNSATHSRRRTKKPVRLAANPSGASRRATWRSTERCPARS